MKILYTFIENKEQEVDETETSTNEKGETISVTKKVKKLTPYKFGLKLPTRSLIDEAQLFYGVKFNEALKAGLLTYALIDKRVLDDGGVLTKEEHTEYEDKLKEFGQKRAEYEQFITLEDKETNKEKIKELEGELMVLRKRLQRLDEKQQSVYENTAENYARNKASIWWFLNLSLKYNDDKPELFFDGKNISEKLDQWDKISESDDEFLKNICNKLILLSSFYHRGYAQKEADFDALLKLAEQSG